MSDNCSGRRTFAFIFGLIVGALLGGGLGLLFAPSKGEEMRKKLKKRSEEVKEKVDEIYEDLKEASEPLMEAAEEFEPIVSEASEVISQAVKAVPAVEEGIKDKLTAISGNINSTKKRFFKNIHH